MAFAGSYFSAWPTTCETVAGVFLPHEHARALLETDMTASLPDSVPDDVASVNLATTQQVFRHRLEQVIADCIARACECAISTVFSEAEELSVALCTPAGESVVEAGSSIRAGLLGAQVRALLQAVDARPLRDLYVVCDPEAGSPSLCSYTLIAPCLGTDESLLGYLAVSAELLEQPASREPSWEPALLPDSENESPLNELPPAVGPRYQMFQASTLPTRLGQVRSRETEGHRLPPTKLTEDLLHQLASYACDPSERLVDFRALVSALEHWPADGTPANPTEDAVLAAHALYVQQGCDGIVGDLGGGSLELIDVKKSRVRSGVTLPLPSAKVRLSGWRGASKPKRVIQALAAGRPIWRSPWPTWAARAR